MKARLDGMIHGRLASRRRLNPGGRGYSRFVNLTKWILPGIALALLLLVAAWPRLHEALQTVRLPPLHLDPGEARNLSMVKARYTGTDRQNRPFTVTADVAHQMPKADGLISLDAPKADMTTASGNWLEVNAYTGVYQPQSQLLDLFGNVSLFQDRGNEFHSDSAHVNMAAGTAEGHEPVEGQGPFGHVTADGFRILDRGDTIIFTGHATLELLPHQKESP